MDNGRLVDTLFIVNSVEFKNVFRQKSQELNLEVYFPQPIEENVPCLAKDLEPFASPLMAGYHINHSRAICVTDMDYIH